MAIFLYLMIYFIFAAKGHIDQRMADIAEKVSRGEKVEGKFLTYYLAQEKIPMKAVYGNVTELLLAGVDTVRDHYRFHILVNRIYNKNVGCSPCLYSGYH